MHYSGSASGRQAAPRRLAAVAVLAVLAVASLTPAQIPADKVEAAKALDQKLIAEAAKGSEIMANLTYLSDIIGPRLTGSANLKRANEWTAAKMKSYGLENVRLEPWTIPVGWERGTATARLIEPDNGRTLTVAAMGWTPSTKGKVVADVVVIKAKNSKELAEYKGKLKNAVILRGPPATVRPITEQGSFPGGRPPEPIPAPDKKDGKAGDQPPPKKDGDQPPKKGGFPDRGGFDPTFRRELSEFLRAEGAAAMLSDAGKPQGLLTMSGGWRGNDRVSGTEPMLSLFVSHEHYALLYRLATRPDGAKTRIELEVTNKLIPGPITVYNTVGEIRGSEKPDEFVVLGAHLDSWDLAQGTTDNGTGSSIVLEAARILAKSGVKPKRTIRFVLFTGEEQGLHGSRAYCTQHHKDEMAKTSMALVHDTGTGRVTGIGLQGREAIRPILEAELGSLKDLGVKELSLRGMSGSDHGSFEQVNVPGFMLMQDMSEYRLTHHSQTDTLDKAREPDLIQGAQVMAVTALRVANLENLLPRDRPARDKKKD